MPSTKRILKKKVKEDSINEELLKLEKEELEYQKRTEEHRLEKLTHKLWPLYFLRRYLGVLSPLFLALGVFLGFRGRFESADSLSFFTWTVWFIGVSGQLTFLGLLGSEGFWENSVEDNAKPFAYEILKNRKAIEKEKKEYLDLSTNAELRRAKIELLITAKKDPQVLLEMRQAGLL